MHFFILEVSGGLPLCEHRLSRWRQRDSAEEWPSLHHAADTQTRFHFTCGRWTSGCGSKCAFPCTLARDCAFRGQLHFGLDQYHIHSWSTFLHRAGLNRRVRMTLKVLRWDHCIFSAIKNASCDWTRKLNWWEDEVSEWFMSLCLWVFPVMMTACWMFNSSVSHYVSLLIRVI